MQGKIVVDAGSTSMNWAIIHSDGSIDKANSEGWNASLGVPFPNLSKEIISFISRADQMFYYGAGVTSAKNKMIIRSAIQNINPKIHLEIESDLLAAARALYGDSFGIACILGTGSNVAYYESDKLFFKTPSLGYLLSDEGSGNKIGAEIIKAYFYDTMPESIKMAFKKNYDLHKESLLENLYRRPHANKYMAQFVPFLDKIEDPWKDALLTSQFKELLSRKILAHKNFLSVHVGFVGSIAHVFHKQLVHCCKKYDIHNVQILSNPLEKLISYHRRKK